MSARNPTRRQILEASDVLVRRGQAAVSAIQETIAITRVIIARSGDVIERVERQQSANKERD
jgi:hypothetical protein